MKGISYSYTGSYKGLPALVGDVILRNDEVADSLVFHLNQSVAMLWPGGVPLDGEPILVINYSLLPIVIITYVYAIVVIISAAVCMATTLVFRKKE